MEIAESYRFDLVTLINDRHLFVDDIFKGTHPGEE